MAVPQRYIPRPKMKMSGRNILVSYFNAKAYEAKSRYGTKTAAETIRAHLPIRVRRAATRANAGGEDSATALVGLVYHDMAVMMSQKKQ